MAKSIWATDPSHSEIVFKVKHMMFTTVSGKFTDFEVTIENEDDKFETSQISFSAKTASVDTRNLDRDNHLRSTDFFDADKFPVISFLSTGISKISENQFEISGDLTIKDVTKNVILTTAYSGLMKDPWDHIKIGVSLAGEINRKEFGLTWNSTLETGGVLVAEEIKLIAEIQLIKE